MTPDAVMWLEGQLAAIIAERNNSERMMRTLGVGGHEISAHREATLDIERIAGRWETVEVQA